MRFWQWINNEYFTIMIHAKCQTPITFRLPFFSFHWCHCQLHRLCRYPVTTKTQTAPLFFFVVMCLAPHCVDHTFLTSRTSWSFSPTKPFPLFLPLCFHLPVVGACPPNTRCQNDFTFLFFCFSATLHFHEWAPSVNWPAHWPRKTSNKPHELYLQ